MLWRGSSSSRSTRDDGSSDQRRRSAFTTATKTIEEMARDSCLEFSGNTNSPNSYRLITAFSASGNRNEGPIRATTISPTMAVDIQCGRTLLRPSANTDVDRSRPATINNFEPTPLVTKGDDTDLRETIQGSLHFMAMSTLRTTGSRKCVIVATWSAWTDFTFPTLMNGSNAQIYSGRQWIGSSLQALL